MSRWHVLALGVIPVLLIFLQPASSQIDLTWWTANGLTKIHPADEVPADAPRVVKIQAARNEFEPFQIVLRSEARDFDAVDIEVTDLRSSAGLIPSNAYITVYLEKFLDLKTPSSVEGGTGEWPDPLVPRVDRYTHQKRNAFPFRVSRGRNQPVWFDVYVPPGTMPGMYHGEVRVTVAGQQRIAVPIDLEVWNFDLPSTSSLASTFGFSGLSAVREHFGKYTGDKGVADITSIYRKAGLWHRLTIDGSSGTAPPLSVSNGNVQIQWSDYDARVSPFLEGRVFSTGEPLYGAKGTSIVLHTPPSLKDPEQQVQYWRQVAEHFRAKRWMDRLFVYLWDEPKPAQFAAMTNAGRTIRRADPGLKTLVTAPLHSEWSDFIDIWAPTINCFENKPGRNDYCDPSVERAGYNQELSRGKQLWWYEACNTHGCNIIGRDYFTGWPSYMIDHDGVRNRVLEWLTWKYNIGGELYFNTVEAFGRKDPWQDVHLFGGNGDGTLFYPGRPDVIGGSTHIPIESIRLKLIREGLEDYEYLTLLARLGGSQTANQAVNSFVRRIYDFDSDPQKLYAARESLARDIVRRMGTPLPPE